MRRLVLRARLEVVVAALLFSTGGAAIKATSLDAWSVAGFRSAVAALALLLFLPAARRGLANGRAIAVGCAYAATLVLFVSGNKLTTAASTIFLQSTAPLYVLLLGPWLLGEHVRLRDLAFLAPVAVGLGLFFVGIERAQTTAPDPLRGNLVALGSGVTWALTLVGLRALAARPAGRGSPEVTAVVWGNLIAALGCLPFVGSFAHARPADVAVVLYLGVFQIGLAYVFLTRAVRRLQALELSLLLLLEPVLNPIWAWLVHGERPGRWALAGAALILGATVARIVLGGEPATAGAGSTPRGDR